MYLALRYSAQFLGATIAAVFLYVLMHEELGFSRRLIVVGTLSLAGFLSLVCAVGTAVRRHMK
jgi:hypothetical protein